jgi:hypothetical protein
MRPWEYANNEISLVPIREQSHYQCIPITRLYCIMLFFFFPEITLLEVIKIKHNISKKRSLNNFDIDLLKI